ncbi:hypothetical protein [Aquimarina longa]|uniref:hypothetical protein n=1 Tax=Aquimarina longa TaxID=1080221 RepID=UPI000AF25A4B|nr:hypothetical protein [Aquimarina longa]
MINAINEASSKAFDSGETYIKVSKEYYKLKIFQQLTRIFSFFSKLAIIGGLLFLRLIFLTVSGALLL